MRSVENSIWERSGQGVVKEVFSGQLTVSWIYRVGEGVPGGEYGTLEGKEAGVVVRNQMNVGPGKFHTAPPPIYVCLSVLYSVSERWRGGRGSLTLKYILPGMVVSGTFLPVKAGLDRRLAMAGRASEPSALPTEATHLWHLSHLVLE